jgi:hypothetical protein
MESANSPKVEPADYLRRAAEAALASDEPILLTDQKPAD